MKIKSLIIILGGLVSMNLGFAITPTMTYDLFAGLHARLLRGESAAQLEDAIPHLARNLKTARAVSDAHWTDSTPFDELAKAYILSDQVLDALGIRHLTTATVVHVPAGVMHTYGYLFSQLKTAYGFKGKRWIESRLDERLGLRAGVFSPFTREGEFLSNVTTVLLKLVGEKAKLPNAAKLSAKTRSAGRVAEHVSWRTPEGAVKEATVYTHLVDLLPLKNFETTDVKLLIYEVFSEGKHRLVTAFPIDQKFAESLLAVKPVTDTVFKPRFNLYIDPTWTVTSHRSEGFSALAN